MVLDETALEAMLARQRAAERSHEHTPAVRTVKTDEFEVYERQAEPAPAPANRSPEPQAARPVPAATDFEELPGRGPAAPHAEPAPPAAWPAPGPPRSPEPASPQAPEPIPQPRAPEPPVAEPAPTAPPTRRPQVWPPIRPTPPPRPALHAEASTTMPAAPTHEPMAADVPDPARHRPVHAQHHDAPVAAPAARTHAPGDDPSAPGAPAGNGCRLAIVQAMFNAEITDAMAQQATQRAQAAGAHVTHHHVPGVYDLPLTVQQLARRKDVDAIVVIGCVVQGQTKHDELITFTTAKTLQEISLATDTPIGLGITGPGMTWQQAQARIGNGAHAVDAALVMWRTLQNA